MSPSPQSVSQRRHANPNGMTAGRAAGCCPGTACPGAIVCCRTCTCAKSVNECDRPSGVAGRPTTPSPLLPASPVLALGPYSGRQKNCDTGAVGLALQNPSCPEGCMYRSDFKCCQGAGQEICKCTTGGALTARPGRRPGPRLVPLGVWRRNNPWTTWWGFGPGNWWWRPPSAPAVPWGSYAYYGNVWPWNGVTAPMPNVRSRKHQRKNPDPPVFPGPGAHDPFAPLPPQWFYYQQPTTMGAPYAGMIPAAAPGPPPGVFGRGGRCYSDLDCRRGKEYCHMGICLPKPWSPQENPLDTLCHCDYEGKQCKCTVCWQTKRGLTKPKCFQFKVPDQTAPFMGTTQGAGSRAGNPTEMVSLTQPLAPGIPLR